MDKVHYNTKIMQTNLSFYKFLQRINIFLCSKLPCFVQNCSTLVEIGVLNKLILINV